RFFSEPHEPLIPKFTNHLVTTNFWQTFPSVAVAVPFLFVCGFMTVYFLGQKAFALMPVLTADFSGWRTSYRPAKFASRPHAINVATALRHALRTSWCTRK